MVSIARLTEVQHWCALKLTVKQPFGYICNAGKWFEKGKFYKERFCREVHIHIKLKDKQCSLSP